MKTIKRLQAGSAALMILGMAPTLVGPILLSPLPVLAQYDSKYDRFLPAGTVIPVRDRNAKKILVTPTETSELTLTVSADVLSPRGGVVIPAGSKVKGQLRPAGGGSQFVASEIILSSGETLDVDATSQVITRTETMKKGINPTSIAVGTVVGAGAATALSALFGGGGSGIRWWRSLAGAGAGAIAGTFLNRKSVDLISIDPNSDLNLILQSRLVNPYN